MPLLNISKLQKVLFFKSHLHCIFFRVFAFLPTAGLCVSAETSTGRENFAISVRRISFPLKSISFLLDIYFGDVSSLMKISKFNLTAGLTKVWDGPWEPVALSHKMSQTWEQPSDTFHIFPSHPDILFSYQIVMIGLLMRFLTKKGF